MTSKTRVLVFMGAYLPGFKGGGPVTSIKNLVDRLSDEIDFKIVTPDRDLFSETAYPGVSVREWIQLGREKVMYLPPTSLNILDVLVALRLTPHDVIYLNSFFSPKYTIPVLFLRRLGLIPNKPVVLAVRGEFASAALDLKARKKQVYLKLAQKFGLLRNVLFHATNSAEESRIKDILGSNVSIYLAPPLAKISNPVHRGLAPRSELLKVVFLGRIAPMKNLDYALKVLAKVGMPIEFTIYGPLEDKTYWQLCQELIAKLPTHITVEYAGSLEPTVVSETLSRYDLFFLPTRGENFGHVIAESLAAGCPVLISDQTPWRDLETNGCGWALSLEEPLNFSNMIDKMAKLSPEERSIWSKNSISYINTNELNSDNMKKNLQLFIVLSKLGQ